MFKVKEGILLGGKTITGSGASEVLTVADVGSMAFQNDTLSITSLDTSSLLLIDNVTNYRLSLRSDSGLTGPQDLTFNTNSGSRTLSLASNLSTTGQNITLTGSVGARTISTASNITVSGATTNGRTVTIATGDADRILTLTGNGTISGGTNSGDQNMWSVISDGTTTASPGSLTDTFKFRGQSGVTVAVASNDVTHGDNVLISLSAVPNAALANSAVTFNGTTVSLGGSATITANTTNALTIGNGLSGTSFNGNSAVTIAVSAAENSTASTYYPIFATTQGVAVALGTRSTFTYNPSTGNMTIGGGVYTSNTSADVFSQNATTVTLGYAATTLGLGATTGTTTIRNAAVISGAATFSSSYLEKKVALAANNIDLSLGNYFSKTISGATTLTVSNYPAANTAVSFILELTNGASATTTWWTGSGGGATIKWANGVTPTLTAAGIDILAFYTHDGGVTWRGNFIAKDSK